MAGWLAGWLAGWMDGWMDVYESGRKCGLQTMNWYYINVTGIYWTFWTEGSAMFFLRGGQGLVRALRRRKNPHVYTSVYVVSDGAIVNCSSHNAYSIYKVRAHTRPGWILCIFFY